MSITAPQDAHTRLVLQWLKHLSSVLYVGKVHCYLATKPEVENFRDQGFVLPEVEGLRVQSL